MGIRYVCRSCRQTLAEFVHEVSEHQLGLTFLTPEERSTWVHEDEEGNLTVRILCEYCQDALLTHPELSLLPSPLQ